MSFGVVGALAELEVGDGGDLATVVIVEKIISLHESKFINVTRLRCKIKTKLAHVHSFENSRSKGLPSCRFLFYMHSVVLLDVWFLLLF
jgi:hypothetical protein